jgi:hypothetical protein
MLLVLRRHPERSEGPRVCCCCCCCCCTCTCHCGCTCRCSWGRAGLQPRVKAHRAAVSALPKAGAKAKPQRLNIAVVVAVVLVVAVVVAVAVAFVVAVAVAVAVLRRHPELAEGKGDPKKRLFPDHLHHTKHHYFTTIHHNQTRKTPIKSTFHHSHFFCDFLPSSID